MLETPPHHRPLLASKDSRPLCRPLAVDLHTGDPLPSVLVPRATILSDSVSQWPLQLQRLGSRRSEPRLDLVRRGQDHRHSLGVDRTDLGVRGRREKAEQVGRDLAFADLPHRRPARPEAGEDRERPPPRPSANQMSPPASRLNSLKLVNGTTQRLSGPSQRRQCVDAVLRIFVVPASGSTLRRVGKSTSLPFARSLSARLAAASNSAFCDDGIPHRAMTSSRPSGPERAIGAA